METFLRAFALAKNRKLLFGWCHDQDSYFVTDIILYQNHSYELIKDFKNN